MRINLGPLDLDEAAVAAIANHYGQRRIRAEIVRSFFEEVIDSAIETVKADHEQWKKDDAERIARSQERMRRSLKGTP